MSAAERIARTLRQDILAQSAYPVAASAADVIKLDAMECPYPLPERVRDAIAQAACETPLNRYPQADLSVLKAAVATAFEVPAEADLLFGNGSDELIHLLVQACCEPGDTVLSPWPSFVYFEMAARFDHARFVGVPLTTDLELDLPAMLAAIEEHQPKLVFLALPNNPTGGLWPDAAVQAIIQTAPGLVVIDEAYQPFAGHSWMPRVTQLPNVVIMRTVSKIGLAGLRFGYLAGLPDWISQIDKVRPPYNVDVLTQAVLLAVLREKAVLDEQAARLRADREPLARGLAALPDVRVYPSAGNFILVRFCGKLDGNAVHLALKTRKILVRNFSAAHPLLANCLRISIGTPEENAALLAALQDILSP
ncbi:histidinol-phosphate transaminase [Bordetella avium]|uniref:histidinol-phosphate transaminase n=1 Tax=Bordetella avium TaxID=521 RepID=UPI000E09F27B|nr:histidinol-phosphate transaminase [Bordetella avium]AZY54033.1 histidinol-phosphate transaminase [Bordetella avium]RIQ15195.1 histidinol-phosphate transaminase [Bordetella avium]RIQ20000.1 histidinol-phosphate transaminase [Bordetella avium]RIQ34580.1 histidinol-phosphate transaminase [Bordetella avium]RIQ38694.1 histidinol-phosphate transaminase [Bordetella avium]